MSLAVFDLDYTLLEGDSESLWSQFLLEQGVVDQVFIDRITAFYSDYENGKMDFRIYETYLLQAMAALAPEQLEGLRTNFLCRLHYRLRPYVLERLNWHRYQGHQLLIITAANAFLARPLADLLGVRHLICTDVEMQDHCLTGKVLGTIPFREGKVAMLKSWLSHYSDRPLRDSWGYSDSFNDLPLLQWVRNPIAVTPDLALYNHALEHGWEILT
jgi:HAD superfamily hydrolase (TIGR01490 family)